MKIRFILPVTLCFLLSSGVLPVLAQQPVPDQNPNPAAPAAGLPTVDGTNGRNLPSPLASPPFPGSEWDGAPIIGVSGEAPDYPLYEALGLAKRKSRFKVYGWASIGGNLSTSTTRPPCW